MLSSAGSTRFPSALALGNFTFMGVAGAGSQGVQPGQRIVVAPPELQFDGLGHRLGFGDGRPLGFREGSTELPKRHHRRPERRAGYPQRCQPSARCVRPSRIIAFRFETPPLVAGGSGANAGAGRPPTLTPCRSPLPEVQTAGETNLISDCLCPIVTIESTQAHVFYPILCA